jgi:hypothetical protein
LADTVTFLRLLATMSSNPEDYDEEKAEGCCDPCVTKIQRLFAPISPWIPGLKNVAASGADVVTDWYVGSIII